MPVPVVIETKGLSYFYSRGTSFETKALSDVTLEVYEGEFLAIAGPAGSGKTTLIQHFNGLLKPDEGSVRVFARQEPIREGDLWREVGLVFQIPERQLFAETVHDEVAFGLVNMSLDASDIKRRVTEALSQVGLDYRGFKHRLPLALSQGQQRRVAIASVLAMRPSILIMDEPTAGIDPVARKNFWANIQGLRKERVFTTILVTHNMDEVAEHADRLVVMNEGRIILDGPPRRVFASEDFIEMSGLELPFAARLVRALHNCGKEVRLDVLTLDEAEAEIIRCFGRREVFP